ncbi:2OG-Fe(II) oxygenase family protein [Caballeronia sp. AZ1_KS37]|uniref:2OG-Fe(II) oxygenase n=1 Tax=Caballeronia sp. AZ1_KS37 TaxID=2921756 RepID=UPI0032EFD830
MRNSDFVAAHTDARAGRRIGIAIYFSQEWDAEDGGEIVFRGHHGEQVVLTPQFNSLLVFDVNAHRDHEVSVVRGQRSRLSINGWCMTATDDIDQRPFQEHRDDLDQRLSPIRTTISI